MEWWRAAALIALIVSTVSCSVTPAPTDTQSGDALVSFNHPSLSFSYPARYRQATYDLVTSITTLIAYLSTEPLIDPCVREPSSISCAGLQMQRPLGRNGVFIDWTQYGEPGWEFDPSAGQLVNVGGRRAVVSRSPGPRACLPIQAEQELWVTIEWPGEQEKYFAMLACVRGPNFEITDAEIQAMLDSVTWNN